MEVELFESKLEDILSLLDLFSEVNESAVFVNSVNSFEHSGILTTNKGLIIKLSDKSEFQLTIVKSR